MKAIAQKRGVTASQLALAWVIAKGNDVVPIPGTKRHKYLEENADAVEIKLSAADIVELVDAVPVDQVIGDRYAAANMKAIDR